MLFQDWISVEPEISKGVLDIRDADLNIGIIKDLGQGYWADNGVFVEINKNLEIGNKILFTQHLTIEIDGIKAYRVRGRDIIEVISVKV